MSNWLADSIDNVGTFFNLPEWGISEGQAHGQSVNSGRVLPSGLASGSPVLNSNYLSRQTMNGMNFGGSTGSQSKFDSNDDGSGGGGGSTTSIASAPNYAAQNAGIISQLASGTGVLQNSLNRLPGQLDIAKGNINTQYGQKNSEYDSAFNQNQSTFNNQTTQNQQTLRTNKNAINDQSANGLRGLTRLLGAYGAVGSDMGVAGRAVADRASSQNAGAGQTFAQNQSSLDTNFGNFKNNLDNERKKLADWRTQELNGVEQKSLTTRQDLLSKLADLNGQISAARGGSYSGSAQPYLDQANSLSGQIDNLGRLNPSYTGNTPVYEAPTLGSYNVGNPASFGFGGNGTAAGSGTPFLNLLLGKNDKQKSPLVG